MAHVRGAADPIASSADRPKRATLNIDLGPLRPAVDARAKAEGMRVSDVVRIAVQVHLSDDREEPPAAGDAGGVGEAVYRPNLSARDAAKLDELRARTGRRTRQGVLRALIDGIALAPTGGPAGSQNLGDAVQQLIRSNAELVAIGRNLNQVAHSLNLYPGKTTAADREALERTVAAVYDHLEAAARLAAEIRPLVRLPDEPPPAAPRRARSPRKTTRKTAA
ncbi:plasmid mobilization relaxosome protein MobC [Aquincola sp. S2]|uniref:Plasmid mobilization relaxosome protein MobC n=1 Tax=Pseudaquabacterium terrae TaxID=2732868 RepID=A0ABX2ESI4_9BURK|nr:plasmid mobilization relaxosome protein MobC [Aquabacterium terrae]NRF71394.1 plasmid mobilization relaxosome protein MobC [Aquabacterium terrae]